MRARLAILTFASLMVLVACSGSSHQFAYITTPFNNGISAYRLNTRTGSFTQVLGSPYQTGISPTAVVTHPSGKFAYVSNAGENTISLYKIGSTGALTEVMPRTNTDQQPAALMMDPGGAFLFCANSFSNTITVYSITAGSGALKLISTPSYQTSGFTPIRGAIAPSGKFLYVANSNSASISGFAVDSSGKLTAVPNSPVAVGNGPNWIAIDHSGKFLYVTNLEDGTLSGFTIDSGTGALTPMSGSPFGVANTGTTIVPVSSVVVDSTDKYVYVTTLTTSSSVYGYTIDGTSGAPTAAVTGSPFAAGGTSGFIVLDTTGKLLFVGNQTSNTISGYQLAPSTGTLTLISTTSTTTAPTAMVVIK